MGQRFLDRALEIVALTINQPNPSSHEPRSIADVAKAQFGSLLIWAGTVLALSMASVASLSFGLWLFGSKYLDPAATASLIAVTCALGAWAFISFYRQRPV